ncbi:MAG: biopolymer transporter ExbD [Planctomycetes bacterium]|nr:biopolymer transporter ExbD [Planctomycetota bacterium]
MSAELSDETVNMIPLIDCMFFLILFFMMVTKFTPEEKAIASLLPTDKGQTSAASSAPTPTVQVNIAIYPAGMDKGFQPSEYATQLDEMVKKGSFAKTVYLRVGGHAPIEVQGAPLATKEIVTPAMKEQIGAVHSYIDERLTELEASGQPRKDQPPVIVHCYSGLPWKFSLVAYDAVRAFESKKAGGKLNKVHADLLDAREVTFAPPRIRNYSANEMGNELYEIVHLR